MASRLAALGALLLAGCAASAPLARFENHLARYDSATEALRLWCGEQGLAASPAIRAEQVPGRQAAPRGLAKQLALGDAEPVGYRHVRLSCAGTVLSEAHNWYVPARLTAAMNRALAETDTPFGKVAAPLRFTRQPLKTQVGRGEGCPAKAVSTHRARLVLPDGRPLALVVECYTRANLRR